MNTKFMRIATGVLSVFLIIYVGYQLPKFLKGSYTFQTVYKQTIEDNIPVTGIFFREEKIFPVSQSGIVNCEHLTGEKISSKEKLVSVYPNQDAINRQREIESLEEMLLSLEKAQSSSQTTDAIRPDTLNSMISEYTSRLIAERDRNNFSLVKKIKMNLTEVFARREIAIGSDVDYSGQIENLQSRLTYLQNQDDRETSAVNTDVSGLFVDHIDGFEEKLPPALLETITASQIEQIIEEYPGYTPDISSVKVVTSQKWRYAFTVEEQQSFLFKDNMTVTIRFPGLSQTISAVVEEMRRDSESGRFLIVLRGDTILPFLLENRVQASEIVNTHSGLKVPREALRFNKEGQMGVYAVLMDKMYFRAVNEIYGNESFILSSPDYKSADESLTLQLYDTIIVEGMDLYDQKPVS